MQTFGTVTSVSFIEVSSFQGVLIRGVPVLLFIEVSSFQDVLIRGVPAVLFIDGHITTSTHTTRVYFRKRDGGRANST